VDDRPEVNAELLDERKLNLMQRVRTFVEVRFQEHKARTSCLEGNTPLWKQSLAIPFIPPQDDYTPRSLTQVSDLIYFSLFDEIEENDASRGGYLEGEHTLRTERRFLGSFVLPFSTVYSNGRIEGVFRLETPPFNFGYTLSQPIESKNKDAGMFVYDDVAAGGAAPDVPAPPPPTFFQKMLQAVGLGSGNSTAEAAVVARNKERDLNSSGLYLNKDTAHELRYYASGEFSCYIKVMVTLDPVLTTPPPASIDFNASTVLPMDRRVAAYAQKWLKDVRAVNAATKMRAFRAFAQNSDGIDVLICHYLTPMKPPQGYYSRRALIHLVSLVPFMSDAVAQGDSTLDLWCTVKQTWDIGAGDEEEHGVMLYNYLLYLNLTGGGGATGTRAAVGGVRGGSGGGGGAYPSDEDIKAESLFLVIGRAVPEGDSIYVMIRDTRRTYSSNAVASSFFFINPCSGQVYSAADPHCPLKDIYCLATGYNVWANTQSAVAPYELHYDLLNPDHWRPLYGRRFPAPIGGLSSIQQEVTYTPTSAATTGEIEDAVSTAIRNNLRKWRTKRHRNITQFHGDASSAIADLLPRLEKWKTSGALRPTRGGARGEDGAGAAADKSAVEEMEELMAEAKDKLKTVLKTRSLRGCPFNIPFTDVEDVLVRVKSLCLHETNHPDFQYVLAVKAFPAVNEMVSLWIFLGVVEVDARY